MATVPRFLDECGVYEMVYGQIGEPGTMQHWSRDAGILYIVQYGLYCINIETYYTEAAIVAHSRSRKSWTVSEAKAHLSRILRLSEAEGPQRIGIRKSFVVMPADVWDAHTTPDKPLGQWLIDNVPRGIHLKTPDRNEPGREIPFANRDKT